MSKILVFDIETSPNVAYVWAKYQQDVIRYLSEWEILCFAYKWLGEDETIVAGRDHYSEEVLVQRLHQLFDEADIVVAHNGNSFDIKKCNAKFIEFGLTPPSPFKSIDTKLVARRYFKFNSNKLDDLGDILGLGRKVQTGGFDLWVGCMNNDASAWRKMVEYNKQDVDLLEQVYLKLRPWMDNHPAINVLDGKEQACPKCGKGPMHKRGRRKINKTTFNQRYQCQSCGGWSQSRKSKKTTVRYTN